MLTSDDNRELYNLLFSILRKLGDIEVAIKDMDVKKGIEKVNEQLRDRGTQ